MSRLLGTTEAAEELGISPKWLGKLIRQGRVPAIKVHARAYVLDEQDVERLKTAPRRRPGRPRKGTEAHE